jgi:hypothetical protein
VEHCYECHSVEKNKSKGGLQVDWRDSIRAGGDTGPAVVPGDPSKSLLLTAIKHNDPDLEMPPKKAKLPESVIADFEAWIKGGAVDPRESPGKTAARPPIDIESGRKFWSYQKPVAPERPLTKQPDWATRDLDHFVLEKLEDRRIAPSPDAEPVVFLRRLYFDLIGLPPTPEQAATFSLANL